MSSRDILEFFENYFTYIREMPEFLNSNFNNINQSSERYANTATFSVGGNTEGANNNGTDQKINTNGAYDHPQLNQLVQAMTKDEFRAMFPEVYTEQKDQDRATQNKDFEQRLQKKKDDLPLLVLNTIAFFLCHNGFKSPSN